LRAGHLHWVQLKRQFKLYTKYIYLLIINYILWKSFLSTTMFLS
jgi:hypothetical protein